MLTANERKALVYGRLSHNQKQRILLRLYAQIPEMTCFPGCNACCCGHPAWSRFEWYRLGADTRANFNMFTLMCDFRNEQGRCDVFDLRPFTCRVFGTVEGNTINCPYGIAPAEKLTIERAQEISKIYHKVFFELEDNHG